MVISSGYSQSYVLSGNLFDQDNQPIETGDVLLFDQTQKLIKSTIIIDGKFSFDTIETDTYTLSISSLGYKTELRTVQLDSDKTMAIVLKETTVALDEVTVKSTKSNFRIENGNIKVTIENSIFESLSTPTEVLSKLPGIQISPDQESISIIGRGSPLIYVDNQKIDLDQLKSLSTESIKNIEIIDNPSAKYEAEGRSLILITRKQRKDDGYKIQLSEIASFKRKFSNYAQINANFKKHTLELRTNFSYNQLGFWESVDSKLIIPSQNITSQQETKATGPRPQFIWGGDFFYQLNPSDYISGQVNYRAHIDRFPVVTNTILDVNQVKDFIISDSQNNAPRSFLSSNINFNKKLTNTSTAFLGIQYSNYTRDLKSLISNNINQTGFAVSQNRDQQYQINVLALRVDLEKKLSKNTTLEIGASLSNGDAVAFSDFEFFTPRGRITSTYDYEEDIYASYIQISGNIKKISYSAGVRSEVNTVKGGFRNDQEVLIDRKQTRLFPKIKVTIPIDSTKSMTLNYNATINRPSYLNASSISTFINPLVEFSRNVNLKPTTTEEVSTNFQYKKYDLTLSYFKTKNPVFFSPIFDSSENRIISSPQNFEEESGYSLQLRNTTTYKLWTMINAVTANYSKINDAAALLQKTKPYIYYYSNNEFKLNPKTTIAFNFWGLTKRYQGVFKRNSIFVLGASLSRTFFKDFQVTINANDIFRNMNFRDQYTINNITSEDIFYVNAQEISFSLKYSFGKENKSSFKNKDIDDNLNRM
ncbi:outer membrane beta-barrel family protein [Aquimarina mytili]